ncbi:hypothetical protein, partial [Rhodoplanes sp. SY1]|uniref:hypothetical protein n=1 Tax=Rhodoplanes sp. SY1 TaxID=3166646 RepID=UPI0038B586F1
SLPVTEVYDSGNLTVRAGRDLLGGSYYEGSGHASIMVAGSIGANGSIATPRYASTAPNVPQLAVDSGQITLVARGSLSVGGVINPAALHAQRAQPANATEASTTNPSQSIKMDTYGPDSKVSLLAVTGNLNISAQPAAGVTLWQNPGTGYPASFEAVTLTGNIMTAGLSVNTLQ